jgi:hypothetical protein
LLTRIGEHPYAGPERLHGLVARGACVDVLKLEYDAERWRTRFLASWPEGSAAHASYYRRIVAGPVNAA